MTAAAPYDYDSYATKRTYTAAATYVTGAHAFKAGMQLSEGPYRETYSIHGDLELRLRNGAADSGQMTNSAPSLIARRVIDR